jgi:hypothetical protein
MSNADVRVPESHPKQRGMRSNAAVGRRCRGRRRGRAATRRPGRNRRGRRGLCSHAHPRRATRLAHGRRGPASAHRRRTAGRGVGSSALDRSPCERRRSPRRSSTTLRRGSPLGRENTGSTHAMQTATFERSHRGSPSPSRHESRSSRVQVVIGGGGVAAVEAALALREMAADRGADRGTRRLRPDPAALPAGPTWLADDRRHAALLHEPDRRWPRHRCHRVGAAAVAAYEDRRPLPRTVADDARPAGELQSRRRSPAERSSPLQLMSRHPSQPGIRLSVTLARHRPVTSARPTGSLPPT